MTNINTESNFISPLNHSLTSFGEPEINGYYRNTIINSNLIGLSYYEVIAAPRIIKDFTQINLSKEKISTAIKEVFKCSICLCILTDPVNIKNCLHKFCKKCIEDYNRKIKKECAICRQVVETRRHMIDDDSMKKIISCIIPDIKLFNQYEENEIESKMHNWYFDFSKVPKPEASSLNETTDLGKANSNSRNANNSSKSVQDSAFIYKAKNDKNANLYAKKAKTSSSDELDHENGNDGGESMRKNKNDFLGKRRNPQVNSVFNIPGGADSNSTNNSNTVLNKEKEGVLNKEEIKVLTIILTTVKDPLAEINPNHHLQYDTKLKIKLQTDYSLNLIEKYLMYKLNLKPSTLINFFFNGKKLENSEKLKDIKLMSECLSKGQDISSDIKLDYTINYQD